MPSPARDESRQNGGADELHERAYPEERHAAEQDGGAEGDHCRHLPAHERVVLGLSVQNGVLKEREKTRGGWK